MATPVYYTGNTYPYLSGTVTDSTGAAVDISTATSLKMTASGKTGAKITGTATKDDDGTTAKRGTWHYVWGATDLSTADTYTPEIELTWSAGLVESFRDDTQTFIVKTSNG